MRETVKRPIAVYKFGYMLENPVYLKIPISVKILQWGQSAGKAQTQNKLVFVESSETIRQILD